MGENYDAVARSAAAAVGAETCHLALYDPETDELIARRGAYYQMARHQMKLADEPGEAEAAEVTV